MIFLIEYDQTAGQVVTLREFADAQRREADDVRLQIELDLNRKNVSHEVVLLEAENEQAIRRTHRRYFGGFREALEEWQRSEETKYASRHSPAGD